MKNFKTVSDFRNERRELWEQAKALIENSTDRETGMVPPEAMKEYEEKISMIRRYDDEIKRFEEIAETDRRLYGPKTEEKDANGAKAEHGKPGERASALSSDTYRNAFWNMIHGQGNYPDVMDALSIGVDAEGGYTVPDEFDGKLVRGLEESNVIRRLARVMRTESGEHKIPLLTGEASVGWMDESAPVPVTDMAFGKTTLSAYKMGALLRATNEFLRDTAFDIEGYVVSSISRAVGRAEEDAFINGSGIKQPTGLLHDTDGAGIGATTEKAGGISFDDIIRLYYSLGAPYRKNAVFLCNEDSLMHLMLLKDGNGNYIWKPSLEVGKPDTILGKPIYTSTAMPEMKAGNKAVLYGDFSHYWIAERGRRTFRRLDELFATDEHVGFMLTQRLDGKLVLKDAMKAMQVKE